MNKLKRVLKLMSVLEIQQNRKVSKPARAVYEERFGSSESKKRIQSRNTEGASVWKDEETQLEKLAKLLGVVGSLEGYSSCLLEGWPLIILVIS